MNLIKVTAHVSRTGETWPSLLDERAFGAVTLLGSATCRANGALGLDDRLDLVGVDLYAAFMTSLLLNRMQLLLSSSRVIGGHG